MSKSIKNKRHAAYVAQSCRCFYCTAPMWEGGPDQFALKYGITLRQARLLCCTAEHLTPRSEGGSNAAENIAAACLHCNRTRHRAHKPLASHAYLRLVRSRVREAAGCRTGWRGWSGDADLRPAEQGDKTVNFNCR